MGGLGSPQGSGETDHMVRLGLDGGFSTPRAPAAFDSELRNPQPLAPIPVPQSASRDTVCLSNERGKGAKVKGSGPVDCLLIRQMTTFTANISFL